MKKRYYIFFAIWENEKPMAPGDYLTTPPDSYERLRVSFKSYGAARRYRMRLERLNPNPPQFYRFRLARIYSYPLEEQ